MIEIGTPYITSEGDYFILNNTVTIDGLEKNIWFKVDKKFEPYLCDERNDAYLIACLNYAMRNNHDIVSEIPITETLLFNINTYLIPALIENNPSFHKVRIQAQTDNTILPSKGAVGTGISCGVDSLHAIANHLDSIYPNHVITHVTFNNVGSHGEGEAARKLYLSRIERPRQFAEDMGYTFVASDSNLMDVIEQSHFKTHTYSSMFPVFCLQKLFSIYYYASGGYKFNEFDLKDKPQLCCGSYELLSLPIFSTPNITICSDGMGLTRMGKIKQIINYKPSYRYLNVCLEEGDNCGHCEKCVRTLLGLDALGVVDRYKEVFNVDYYHSHKKWYLQQMLYRCKDGKHDYFEIYPYLAKGVTPMMKIKALGYGMKIFIIDSIRKNPSLLAFAKRIKKKIKNV